MSAAAIYRQLQDNGSIRQGELSESTSNRYINQLALELKTTNNQDMRRYERPHINEVWCGDSSVGPYLKTPDGKKHKLYIIALIDDASRFITGVDIFYNDNFVNLMSVMKSAVAKYGRPKLFNFDNGSAYKNRQMELLAARIGSTLNYCRPYTPTAKAKILYDGYFYPHLFGNVLILQPIFEKRCGKKTTPDQTTYGFQPLCLPRYSRFPLHLASPLKALLASVRLKELHIYYVKLVIKSMHMQTQK